MSKCSKRADVLVRFDHSPNPVPYCADHSKRWHKQGSQWRQVPAWRGNFRTRSI